MPAIFLVVGIAAIGVLTLNLGSPSAAEGGEVPRPVLGRAAAPVAIHEYGDFQCPSCGAFARSIEPQVRAAYIDTGKARLVWHDFA
ncbi:MAG: thioredoxin domain-containing protein, partial [Chloroflexi bacterium]|nr:thioredoxin domain-containing protein [Chloroflexota bacterium]